MFLEATCMRIIINIISRIEEEKKQQQQPNTTKNWAKRRRFMFYRVVGWFARACLCVCASGSPHLIGT